MLGIFSRLLDSNEKQIKKIDPVVGSINDLEKKTEKLSDANLKAKTAEFRKRVEKGETLDDILPEAYAADRKSVV